MLETNEEKSPKEIEGERKNHMEILELKNTITETKNHCMTPVEWRGQRKESMNSMVKQQNLPSLKSKEKIDSEKKGTESQRSTRL